MRWWRCTTWQGTCLPSPPSSLSARGPWPHWCCCWAQVPSSPPPLALLLLGAKRCPRPCTAAYLDPNPNPNLTQGSDTAVEHALGTLSIFVGCGGAAAVQEARGLNLTLTLHRICPTPCAPPPLHVFTEGVLWKLILCTGAGRGPGAHRGPVGQHSGPGY